MGEVGGVEVSEAARNQPEPPEVVLLTGNGDLATAAAAVRLGAFDYLLKPVRPALLLERVAAASDRRVERQQQAAEVAAWRAVARVVGAVQPHAPAAAPLVEAKPERYRVVGQLQIDTQRREITFDGQLIAVTPIEYTILHALAETPATVMTYGTLAQRTHAAVLNEREAYGLLRTHVRNLRRKIGHAYLVSVRGVGYMLDASGQATSDDD
jgi:DNA-binding response OmpR family regulator